MVTIQTVLITLFLTLVFFHALICWKPTHRYLESKRFWIKVDYIWISLSFISIFSIVRELQEYQNSWKLRDAKNQLTFFYNESYSTAFQYGKLLHPSTTTYNYPAFDDQNEVDRNKQMADWYLLYAKTLNEKYNSSISADSFDSLRIFIKDKFSTPTFIENDTYLIGMKESSDIFPKGMMTALDKIEEIKLANEPEDWENQLKFISPFLLAFAIALRLSKVTAQLKRER